MEKTSKHSYTVFFLAESAKLKERNADEESAKKKEAKMHGPKQLKKVYLSFEGVIIFGKKPFVIAQIFMDEKHLKI